MRRQSPELAHEPVGQGAPVDALLLFLFFLAFFLALPRVLVFRIAPGLEEPCATLRAFEIAPSASHADLELYARLDTFRLKAWRVERY